MTNAVIISENNSTIVKTREPIRVITYSKSNITGGAVTSVNTQTGAVVLDADDISDTSTANKYTTATEITKLSGIESNATTDQTGAEIKSAYELEANAFTDTKDTKLSGIETLADVTDETNVKSSLDGATITAATVATGDKVLIQDISDTDNLKSVTAQSIADLAAGGTVFLDSEFIIQNATDTTKQLIIDNSSISTATDITWTISNFNIDFNWHFNSSLDVTGRYFISAQSTSRGRLYLGTDLLTSLQRTNASNLRVIVGNLQHCQLESNGNFTFNPSVHMQWASSQSYDSTQDTGIKRVSAELLSITDGSTGIGQLLYANPQNDSTALTGTIDATTQRTIIARATSACTRTLPTAVGITGVEILVKNLGVGQVTMLTTSSQLMDAFTSGNVKINPNDWARFESDGTNWIIVG